MLSADKSVGFSQAAGGSVRRTRFAEGVDPFRVLRQDRASGWEGPRNEGRNRGNQDVRASGPGHRLTTRVSATTPVLLCGVCPHPLGPLPRGKASGQRQTQRADGLGPRRSRHFWKETKGHEPPPLPATDQVRERAA